MGWLDSSPSEDTPEAEHVWLSQHSASRQPSLKTASNKNHSIFIISQLDQNWENFQLSPNAATTNSDCGSPLLLQRWSFPVCWQHVQVLPPCSSSDRTGQGFQISTFLLVGTPKLFFTTSRPHAGKRCHGNKAITQRQPQTGRPSKVACTHTQTHTKLQFTTTTAVTQRHSVPLWKADCVGYFWRAWKAAALERWRKWLPTGRRCWQRHTHSSILPKPPRFISLAIWNVFICPWALWSIT